MALCAGGRGDQGVRGHRRLLLAHPHPHLHPVRQRHRRPAHQPIVLHGDRAGRRVHPPPLGRNLFVLSGLTGEPVLKIAGRAIPFVASDAGGRAPAGVHLMAFPVGDMNCNQK